MENKKEFDLWSDGYGAAIHLLNDNDEYPVAGYATLLNKVYSRVRQSEGKKLLDAGFGTGIITKKLYKDGYDIYGMDMSEQIVEAGKEEMPNAHLYCCDYSMGMPLKFIHEEFDIIISTYAFHHLDYYEKADLIRDMLRHLKKGGKLIVGDLAFESAAVLKEFRKANKEKWLYGDMYMVYDELAKDYPEASWKKISKCAGIIEIVKE